MEFNYIGDYNLKSVTREPLGVSVVRSACQQACAAKQRTTLLRDVRPAQRAGDVLPGVLVRNTRTWLPVCAAAGTREMKLGYQCRADLLAHSYGGECQQK